MRVKLTPLTTPSVGYKPFVLPWAYDAWKAQQQVHWMPEEVPMADDVRDWKFRLTPEEKNLLTHIFRFFTQQDIEVMDCYHNKYQSIFQPVEVKMMLSAFTNMETIHVAAYSLILETVGMPETEYSAFLKYKEMKDKSDYMKTFSTDDAFEIAKTLAAFGAFTEGLQLFASFAMLMNFPRHGKMKGMGQIVSWSIRDETLHMNSIIRLYHEWVKEHPEIAGPKLDKAIVQICRDICDHEDLFIDLAFEMGDIKGLSADDTKGYIRCEARKRLRELGINPDQHNFAGSDTNPLPWMESLVGAQEHANFFEARSTEYGKAATEGDWDDVYS